MSVLERRKMYELWARSYLMRLKNVKINERTRLDNSMLRIIGKNTTSPTLIFRDQIPVTMRAMKPITISLRGPFNVSRRMTPDESLCDIPPKRNS
jgi:hypothetical protein